ncbi:PREDICTED: uncharacterized protein LOC104812575 isoform X2 [Tarenaya hassleriana]|uniref:uncharacterized protein LOC104812575 isoform X2 n=1 Tax=Tarenaya hassleriana TaxID=28532 RepID=UPI00053C212F|nr:PREDICTED: uncharacterized protein LOC104812575 isoform X2 [Tarenaya hassleriana]
MVRGYRGSHSRASSDSSESTRGDSGEDSSGEEEMASSVYSAGKVKGSTEWTDEKHSLYLKSMEATFVDQLYNSLGNLGSHCNKKNATDEGPSRQFCSIKNSYQEQFKVHRAGFWQRMDVKQSEYCFNRSDACHEFLASPWIKHFRPLSEGQSPECQKPEGSWDPENRMICPNWEKGMVICSSGSASTLKKNHSGHFCLGGQDQINNREEVSDQNFVDEETKEEKASSKKMKIRMSESSSNNDQVVPYGKAPAT